MKFYRFMPALAAALVLSLSACGGDDNDGNEPGSDGSGTSDYTIEDTKEFVSATASEFMSKFKASDQEELIKLLSYVSNQYGNLSMPDELDPDDDDVYPYRSITRSSKIIDLANNYNGIYEPGNGEWVKVMDSKDLVFRANDAQYGKIELKVTRSAASSNVNYQDYSDSYEVIVPKTITAVLTAGGKTMLTENIVTEFNQSAKTLKATETITAANLKCVAIVNATNSQANANTTFSVSGETLVTAKATLSGKNLCDIDAINNAVNNEDFASLLTSGNFSGDIMGKIQVQGNITFNNDVFNAMDSSYDFGSYSDSTQEQASQDCDNAVNALNNNISAWVTFNGTPGKQATLSYIKNSRIYNDVEGKYYPTGVITFADGTTYTDEFFETGFDTVISQWESLLNSYENICY